MLRGRKGAEVILACLRDVADEKMVMNDFSSISMNSFVF